MANYDSDTNVVKQVQTAINGAGYVPPLVVDGAYGPNTAAGVKWFQGVHNLTQDGIIGDQTVAATIAAPPNGGPISPLLLGPGNTPFVPPVNSLPTKIPPAGVKPYIAPPTGQIVNGKVISASALKLGARTGVLKAIPMTFATGIAKPAAAGPVATAPGAFAPPGAVVAPAAPASSTPSWLWTALGLVTGLGGGYFLGHLAIGGAAGALVGGTIDILRAPAAPAPAAATVHGEVPYIHLRGHPAFAGTFFGMDVNMDDTEGVIAGDMGCAAPAQALRG